MKQSTIQLFTLFAFAAIVAATPAPIQRRNDDSLKALCATNDHHCVYAQGKGVTVDLTSCLGCDSKGTTCVFDNTAKTYASCPDGSSVSITFGASKSYFVTSGAISAYFSSEDHNTSATKSKSAGDDVHVSCGSPSKKTSDYGGQSSGSGDYGGQSSSTNDYGGQPSVTNDYGGSSSGSAGYGSGYGNA